MPLYTCPHCGETIQIDQPEIITATAISKGITGAYFSLVKTFFLLFFPAVLAVFGFVVLLAYLEARKNGLWP